MSDFYVFGIKVGNEGSVGQRKLEAGKFYHLFSGFRYDDAHDVMFVKKERLDNLFSVYNDFLELQLRVNISAIVGENGSGKSSLVEFMFRLINNFAAATLGEDTLSIGTEHLHYIDGVNGELFFMLNNNPHRLKVDLKGVELWKYSRTPNSTYNQIAERDGIPFISDVTPIFCSPIRSKRNRTEPITLPYNSENEKETKAKAYAHFFYTMVSNNSLYAYNTSDYENECNSYELELKIKENEYEHFENKPKYDDDLKWQKSQLRRVENRSWLHGIFHKNDGYQTPLVLTPYRNSGNIDINKESILAKERLLALILCNKTFKTINGHLKVSSLHITESKTKYSYSYIRDSLDMKMMTREMFEGYKELTSFYWARPLGKDSLDDFRNNPYYDRILSYITYKTLKISKQYGEYGYYYRTHKDREDIDAKEYGKLISFLLEDGSHVTSKIRRSLAFLYSDFYSPEDIYYDVDKLSQKIDTEYMGIVRKCNVITTREDLLPPPIFDVEIILQDNETGDDIKFEWLSSGEKQQAYTVASVLYHLSNLESVHLDSNNMRFSYDNALIVLEEIELYFHPELQKQLVLFLLDGIKQMQFNKLSGGIHILIVTHSPFVLSDIPSKNILPMRKGNQQIERKELKSFGANIHQMLGTSFFLKNGAIGDYASWRIKEIVKALNCNSDPRETIAPDERPSKLLKDNKAAILEAINTFDEPIVRNALMDEYLRVFGDEEARKREIRMLEQRIEELNKD